MAASNTFLTNDVITNEALVVLRNNFTLVPRAMQNINDLFGQAGYKNGATARIRIPVRYTSALQGAINLNNSIETETSLTLLQRNIGISFTTIDRTLDIDLFSDRFIKPAMAQLATDIDQDGYKAFLTGSYNLTTPGSYTAGVPANWIGSDVATLKPFNDARARLREQAAPTGDMYVAVTPSCSSGVVDFLKSLFQSSVEIAEQYKTGLMGIAAGFEWVESQVLPSFTAGTRSTTGATVNGGGNPVTGSSITLAQGSVTTTITAGDQLVIDGVYAINPLTRSSTGKLQVFTVQSAATFVAGAVTLSVLPAINVTAPDQTVITPGNGDLGAADGAAVTFMGSASASTDMNIAWQKNAIVVAFCDLDTDLPGAEAEIAQDPESKISIRFVRQYQNADDNVYCRFDVLYGWRVVRGSLACRIQG